MRLSEEGTHSSRQPHARPGILNLRAERKRRVGIQKEDFGRVK